MLLTGPAMNVKDFQRLVFMIKSIYPEDRRCVSEVCSARIVVGRRADFAKVLVIVPAAFNTPTCAFSIDM
jgi:hypothetical protein